MVVVAVVVVLHSAIVQCEDSVCSAIYRICFAAVKFGTGNLPGVRFILAIF